MDILFVWTCGDANLGEIEYNSNNLCVPIHIPKVRFVLPLGDSETEELHQLLFLCYLRSTTKLFFIMLVRQNHFDFRIVQRIDFLLLLNTIFFSYISQH